MQRANSRRVLRAPEELRSHGGALPGLDVVSAVDRGYTARPLRLDEDREREALIRLWAENMGDPRIRDATHERMRWLYEANPSGWPRTWVGVAADQSVIGCGSLLPRRMLVGGRQLIAGILIDFAVDRRHRLAGPAIVLQRAIMEGSRDAGFDFLLGWPNAKSVAVMKRIGYMAVGLTRSWVKPLRTASRLGPLIAERFATRLPSWVAPEGLARFGGPVLDRLLLVRDFARRAIHLPGTQLVLSDRIDARVDELWARAATSFTVGEKTSAYLGWRYSGFPTERYRFGLLMERRSDRLLGYVAFALRGDAAHVVDLFVEDIDRHVGPLLLGLGSAMRRESVRSISLTYLGTQRLSDHLPRLGFFDRGGERPLIIWLAPGTSEDLRTRLTNPENWLMLDGELDI
jgi:hypothetical protein